MVAVAQRVEPSGDDIADLHQGAGLGFAHRVLAQRAEVAQPKALAGPHARDLEDARVAIAQRAPAIVVQVQRLAVAQPDIVEHEARTARLLAQEPLEVATHRGRVPPPALVGSEIGAQGPCACGQQLGVLLHGSPKTSQAGFDGLHIHGVCISAIGCWEPRAQSLGPRGDSG